MDAMLIDIRKGSWWGLLFLFISIVLACSLAFVPNLTELPKALTIFAFYISFATFLGPRLLLAARSGHRHIISVCIFSGVLIFKGVACFYWIFFSLSFFDESRYERILNIIPVLVAAWAAGLGWFIHYQLTSKANRVKHALDLVMETKKNSEFRKQSELASKHFPPRSQIDDSYIKYFSNTSIRDIEARNRLHPGSIPEEEIEKAKAVLALKYVLNYFELMAVGIRKNELDEDLIYEAMGATLAGTFRRSKKFVEYCIEIDPIVFRDLAHLSEKWEHRLEEDRMTFKRTKVLR